MSTSQATINGILVPHIVPYDAKGRIAEDELRHIIRLNILNTSEGPTISEIRLHAPPKTP